MRVAIIVRLATIAAALVFARRTAWCRRVALAGSIVASALTLMLAIRVLVSGDDDTSGVLLHHGASGISLAYSVAPLSAWFLLVLGLVAIPVAVHSDSYFAHAVRPSRTLAVSIGFNVLLGAVEAVFAAADVIGFLFAWEIMSLATAALVATEHECAESRRAAYLYLVMSHVGTGCLLAGFLILGAKSGSLSFPLMLSGHAVVRPLRDVLFVLFFLGFGVKAGIVPLHVWLPEAHPAAPSSVSALMSAVLITAGIYGLFRVCAFGLGVPAVSWGLAAMALGTLSAILGVLYALTQSDIKRLLAYSTIENSGIIVLGLGTAMTALGFGRTQLAGLAVTASLAHVLNHALFKSLLFLGAGSVAMASGTRHLEQLGGLLRRMPWTGLFFLAGSIAIAGLPLLNGFVSEWLTFQALLDGFRATPGLLRLTFPLSGALLALASALAAACFVKAFGITFLAMPRSDAAADAHESPRGMLAPMALLALLCLALGLFPGVLLRALAAVITSLPVLGTPADLAWGRFGMQSPFRSVDHVAPLAFAAGLSGALLLAATVTMRARQSRVRRVQTWGCGGELSPVTEYTATAFSKPLMMVFRAVYRPTREVEALARVSPYFPEEVRYRAQIEPTFERYVYGPVVRAVMRVADAMKVLQAGSLHAYLAYVLVLGVLLLIWLGGAS